MPWSNDIVAEQSQTAPLLNNLLLPSNGKRPAPKDENEACAKKKRDSLLNYDKPSGEGGRRNSGKIMSGSLEDTRNFFTVCCLCDLHFQSELELDEHLYSLLHHRALDTEKGKDFTHQCNLCHHKCKGLGEYVSHLRDEDHKKKVEKRKDDLEEGRPSKRVHSLIRYKNTFMYPPTKKTSVKDQPASSMSSSMKDPLSHNTSPPRGVGFQRSRSFSGRTTQKKLLLSDEDAIRFSRPRNVYHTQNHPPSEREEKERRWNAPQFMDDHHQSQGGFSSRFLHPKSQDSFRGSEYHQHYLSSGSHDDLWKDLHPDDEWHPAFRDEQRSNNPRWDDDHHGDGHPHGNALDERPHSSMKSSSSLSKKERIERYDSPLMRSYTNKPLRKFKHMLQRNIRKQSKENNPKETPPGGPFSNPVKNLTSNWTPLEVQDLHISKPMFGESVGNDEATRGFSKSNRSRTKSPPTSRSTDDTVSSQAPSVASSGKISSTSTLESVGVDRIGAVRGFTFLPQLKNPFHEDDSSLPTLTFSNQLTSATSFSRQTTSESGSATSLKRHRTNRRQATNESASVTSLAQRTSSQSSSSTSLGNMETHELRNKFRSIMDEIEAPSSCRSMSSSTAGSLVTSSDTTREKDSIVAKRHRPPVVADKTLPKQDSHSMATSSGAGVTKKRDNAATPRPHRDSRAPTADSVAATTHSDRTSDDDEAASCVREKLILLAEKKQKEAKLKATASTNAEDDQPTAPHPLSSPKQEESGHKNEGSESEDTSMCESNKKKLMPKPNIGKARSRLKTSLQQPTVANSDSDGERKHSRMAKLLLTMGARTKTAPPTVTVSPQRQAKLKIKGPRFGIGLPPQDEPSDFSLDESDLQDIVMSINEAEGLRDDLAASTEPKKFTSPILGGGEVKDQSEMSHPPKQETVSPNKAAKGQRSPGGKKYSKKRSFSSRKSGESSHSEYSQGPGSSTGESARDVRKIKHKKTTRQPISEDKIPTKVNVKATVFPSKAPNNILPPQNVSAPGNSKLVAPVLVKTNRPNNVTMPSEHASSDVIDTSRTHPTKQRPTTPANAPEPVLKDDLSSRLLHMSEREELLHSQDNAMKAQSMKLHDEMTHVDNLIEQLTLRKKELDEEMGKIDEEEKRIKSDLESIRQHRLVLLRGTVGSSIPPPPETPIFRPESCAHSTPTPSSNPDLTYNSPLPAESDVHSIVSDPSNVTRYDTAMTFDLPSRDISVKSESHSEPDLPQKSGPSPTNPFPVASSSVYFDSMADKAESKVMTSSINTILKKYLKEAGSDGEVTSSTTPQRLSTSSQDEVTNSLPPEDEVTSTTLQEEPANRRLKGGHPQPAPSAVNGDEGMSGAPPKPLSQPRGGKDKKKPTKTTSDHPQRKATMKNPPPNDVTKSWITAHDVTTDSTKGVIPVKLTSEQLSIASLKTTTLQPHSSSVLCLVVTNCGKVITCAKDKCLNISDIATGRLLKTCKLPFPLFKAFANSEVCVDADHSLVSVYLVFADDTAEHNTLKDYGLYQLQVKISNTPRSSVRSFQFTLIKLIVEHDFRILFIHRWKELLYLSTKDGRVIIFNTATFKLVDTLDCHSPHAIHCLTTGTEGPRRVLCCGSSDCRISVRDAEDGLLIKMLTGHSKTVNCLQLKGNLLYSGASDRTVLVHNIHTGDVVYRFLRMHYGSIKSLHIEHDGLVSLCLDKCVRVLRTEPCRTSGPPKAVSSPPISMYVHHSSLDQYSGVMLPFAFVGCMDGAVNVIPLTQLAYKPLKPAGDSMESNTDTSFQTDDMTRIDLIEGLDCLWSGCGASGFTTGSALLTHINLFHATIYYKEALNSCCLWGDCTHYFSSDIDTVLDVEVHMDKHVHDAVMDVRV